MSPLLLREYTEEPGHGGDIQTSVAICGRIRMHYSCFTYAPNFTGSLVSRESERSYGSCISHPSYTVPKFHVNPPTLPPTAVRLISHFDTYGPLMFVLVDHPALTLDRSDDQLVKGVDFPR